MLDRIQEPAFGKIESINLVEPTVHHLSNGIPVFSINAGTQNVVKVELVFGVGTASTGKMLLTSATVNLLKEGTETKSASEIAEAVDFYGAYLQSEVTHDESSLTLFSLGKHLNQTLPILAEVFSKPAFSEREFETYILKSQQEMLVNMEKVGYLCSKAYTATLFGEDHPYGRSANPEDYSYLTNQELVEFHGSSIKPGPKYIIVSGKLNDDIIALLEKRFGNFQVHTQATEEVEVAASSGTKMIAQVKKPGSVQNAIRIGRVLFNRTHQDFVGMQILATVLGGYFGSRLMSNIREDKGYTYGVGAGIVSLKGSGYLSISTEVGSDVCQAALNEIYFEIERLRKHLIPTDELELVRNYMLGSVLKSIDGPFHIASKWKTYLNHGLGIDAHHAFVHQIKTITPERLKELAQKYLQREDLKQVVAGKPL